MRQLAAKQPGDAILRVHDLPRLRARRDALHGRLLATLLRFLLDHVVLLHALEEVLVAAALADVLDADVKALAQLAVPDDLRHLNADGRLRHVEHNAGLAVVEVVPSTRPGRQSFFKCEASV